MGSYAGICEIVEAKEENSGGVYPANSEFNVGDMDINRLFEAISAKNSSKGLGFSPQPGSSPLRKNALKKPITVGLPRSPGYGNSESVSLKQALRELCITKASEMAAIKRLSNFTGSSGNSEAGRIKSLYNSVVVDTSGTALSLDKGKRGVIEISPNPETNISNSSEKIPHRLQAPTTKPSSQSAHTCAATTENTTGTVPMRDEIVSASVLLQLPKIKTSITPSPQYAVEASENGSGMTPMNKDMVSASMHLPKPVRETSIQSSPQYVVATTKNVIGVSLMPNEIVSAPIKVGTGTLKTEQTQKENHTSVSSHTVENSFEPHKRVPTIKLANKASVPKLGRKGRLQNDNGVSKVARNAPRVAKPVFRNKNFVKKKRQDSTYNDVNSELGPSTSELVCQRCQCALRDATKESTKESNEDSSASQLNNLSAEVSPINVNSVVSKPGFTSNGCNNDKPIVVRVKKNSKSKEKGEVSQSSKSSIGEYSSNTSISDESYASGSSCGNRPHMSKDARWEAIRQIRVQHGFLGLSHFNLLKKLGCGDIGTVYLAELIGTNCLFAIKVMDNEFLARRKKMPRAQTEREILRMLDHPFLPTLYAQFTSDNLSCLVMEYCPGGDLHVLRQKQSGRSFPEQAARFYVAEVLLALEYLHMLGVVYRDLKPENILVREDGHIMLTDFDLSLRCTVNPTLIKSSSHHLDPVRLSGPCTESSCIAPFCIEPSCQVSCFSPRLPTAAKTRKTKADLAAQIKSLPLLVAEPTDARSNSFVGTHEYLAPEIIKGEGHGAAVDWWTFGIFLYELLYGKTPFKGSGNEETLANVVLQNLKFPDCPLISFQARDLIQVLLVKEPEDRLGTEKGAAEIKQHPFFEGLNWALIRCAIPPELPEFYDFGVPTTASQDKKSKYLECKTTRDHLEFELF